MHKLFGYFNLIGGMVLLTLLFSSYSDRETLSDLPGLAQVIKPIDLNREFSFAEEKVPMDNFDVRERLDRELLVNSYLQSTTLLLLKNEKRYFPTVERILREQGVPDDFKYLMVAESGFKYATSSSGAKGFWQFMEPTAREYGLEVNDEVDERFDLEKSTLAACRYLKAWKEKLGSWTLAAAAYNTGPNALVNEMQRQGVQDYYQLQLSNETMRYVFRIIAIKEIMKQPRLFGFVMQDHEKYEEMNGYTTMLFNGSAKDLATLARELGVNYRKFKLYNPWLVGKSLTNSRGKTYELKLPKP